MSPDVVDLASELIAYKSVSLATNVPISRHLVKVLESLRFQVEELSYADENGVEKVSIVAKMGKGKGGLSLMSHADVVPADDTEAWTGSPFEGRVDKGKLYGRGACDMKGPLAASICAAARYQPGELSAPLYIVVTGDEEIGARGAREVTRRSRLFREASSGCGVLCEPTRHRVVYGHKGGLRIEVTSRGRAAHTSTLKGANANLKMIPFLGDMKKIHDLALRSKRYRNDEFNPAHSEWSIGINDHNVALNVSPARSVCTIGYRLMPDVDIEPLIERTRQSARRNGLKFELTYRGEPVYTPPDSPLVQTALAVTGTRVPTTVPFGTDGVAFVTRMKRLIVLGPGDIAQAHTADEWIAIDDLRRGVDVYARLIDHFCTQGPA